jgi:hypothetical protein
MSRTWERVSNKLLIITVNPNPSFRFAFDPVLVGAEEESCLKNPCHYSSYIFFFFFFFFFFRALNFPVESFGLLSDLFPFPPILDLGYPVFDLHLTNVVFDVILHLYVGLPCDILIRIFKKNIWARKENQIWRVKTN